MNGPAVLRRDFGFAAALSLSVRLSCFRSSVRHLVAPASSSLAGLVFSARNRRRILAVSLGGGFLVAVAPGPEPTDEFAGGKLHFPPGSGETPHLSLFLAFLNR